MKFVPRWLIYKTVYSGGRRLQKFPALVETRSALPVRMSTYSHEQDTRLPRGVISQRHYHTISDIAMQFDNMEYRFWMVDVQNKRPKCAICRYCSASLFTLDGRKKHHETQGCARKLVSSYKLLLRDMRCIVCDMYTSSKKWGIPLCDKITCMEVFMHEQPTPEALTSAIQLSGAER